MKNTQKTTKKCEKWGKNMKKIDILYNLMEKYSWLEWDINSNIFGQHFITTKIGDTVIDIFLELDNDLVSVYTNKYGEIGFQLLSIKQLSEFLESEVNGR